MNIQRNNLRVYVLYIGLFLLGILPSRASFLLNASSAALGIFIFTLLLLVFIYKYIPKLWKIPKRLFLFIILFIIYALIQHLFIGSWNERAYTSIAALFYIFIISYLSAWLFNKIDFIVFFKAIKILVYTLVIIAFVNILAGKALGVGVFPFGEPSHYALFSGVFFMIYFILSKSMVNKVLILLVTISLSILFPNTTMLIYAFLMLSLLIQLNYKKIILVSIVFFLMFNIVSNSDYFKNRINISKDSKNLSALVYFQGLDYAKKSLINTNGLGLGFQMMGTQKPSETTILIKRILNDLEGEGLNRYDGGFLAAKIITEFGIFGILILIGYFYLFIRSFFYLRSYIYIKNCKYNPKLVVVSSIFFSFFVEVYVRGIGYFSPGVFIFLVAFSFYFKFKKEFSTSAE
jgi:hypothetical protein